MGFDWARVPDQLAGELARELALDVDAKPADALAATFGAVPNADFIRVAWPTLRDHWLPTDNDARADVVSGLRAAGLGDHEHPPRATGAQLGYLRTVRNTARMRKVVLERFIELGDSLAPLPLDRPDDDDELLSVTEPPVDLKSKVESAWSDLAGALATALRSLPLGGQLTLTLDPTAGGTDDATYFVEFLVSEEGAVHAEAVGNAELPPGHRLGRHAIAALVALGWSPPGVVDGTEGNFGLEAVTDDADRLAAIAVRTLREVYGTPHPAFLTYTARAIEGEPELPPLGVARRVPIGTPEPAAVPFDNAKAPFAARVRGVVAGLMDGTPDAIPVDGDGDISIRSGSAMVFVRIAENPLLVDVYSPVLTEVRPTQRLYERLSQLTRSLPVGRLYVDDDTVWASIAVFGRDFQPSHLMLAIRVMTGLADTLDDRLQGDFGGKVFFGEALPERRENANGERTGMYL